MKRINTLKLVLILIFVLTIVKVNNGFSQTPLPEILSNGTLKDQLDYIEERTRIYENYRAIREDMFQKIKKNSTDSLTEAKNAVIALKDIISVLNSSADSLAASLESTKNELSEVTATKNSIRIIGLDVNKITYNSITWTIIAGLLLLLGIGFLAFRRNLAVTKYTKKELEDLKTEFEGYRQSSREAREKMTLEHFNEMKKLKGQ